MVSKFVGQFLRLLLLTLALSAVSGQGIGCFHCPRNRVVCTENCSSKPTDLKCGSNGLTFWNRCDLECRNELCDSEIIRAVGNGSCGSASTQATGLVSVVIEDKWPGRDPCFCPRIYDPVCGSDMVTYSNLCVFYCAKQDRPGLLYRRCGKCT